MSRKVIVMKDGRIAQSGSPEDIYDRPASRFVADFVGNCNFIEAQVISPASGGICTVRCALGELRCMSNRRLGPRAGRSARPPSREGADCQRTHSW